MSFGGALIPLVSAALLASCAAAVRPIDLRESSAGSLRPERPAGGEAAAAGAGDAGAADRAWGRPAGLGFEHETMKHLVVDAAGYPLEEHFCTTADGFVLGLYRIPHGRSDVGAAANDADAGGSGSGPPPSLGRRPPVLLLHGVLDSSAAWVLNEPYQSLGFILADAGFDVWLGNSRGNQFSRNHTGLDPAQAAFWDFSWDDMAAYDVPAMVAYVLAQANASRLAYVGHSQATTQMFAALSTSRALADKLSVAVMLGPAVHMRHIRALPLQLLAAMGADKIFDIFGVHEFLPTRKAAADLFGDLCRATPLTCASIITAICGFNGDNMNLTRLPTAVQYAPSGTSVKNMAHWGQAIRRSRERGMPLFQMYDYGSTCFTPGSLPRTCNMRMYHALEPPSYDLRSIASPPLALFYGGRDKLAGPEDVRTLLAALPREAVVYTQLVESYEHIDFTWGIDAQARIYPAVLQLLRRFSAD